MSRGGEAGGAAHPVRTLHAGWTVLCLGGLGVVYAAAMAVRSTVLW